MLTLLSLFLLAYGLMYLAYEHKYVAVAIETFMCLFVILLFFACCMLISQREVLNKELGKLNERLNQTNKCLVCVFSELKNHYMVETKEKDGSITYTVHHVRNQTDIASDSH